MGNPSDGFHGKALLGRWPFAASSWGWCFSWTCRGHYATLHFKMNFTTSRILLEDKDDILFSDLFKLEVFFETLIWWKGERLREGGKSPFVVHHFESKWCLLQSPLQPAFNGGVKLESDWIILQQFHERKNWSKTSLFWMYHSSFHDGWTTYTFFLQF